MTPTRSRIEKSPAKCGAFFDKKKEV